jgi:hypothetical protein
MLMVCSGKMWKKGKGNKRIQTPGNKRSKKSKKQTDDVILQDPNGTFRKKSGPISISNKSFERDRFATMCLHVNNNHSTLLRLCWLQGFVTDCTFQ